MKTGRYKRLVRVEQQLKKLYDELKDEECGTDVLLVWCKVGHITTKELLGEYKSPSSPPDPEDEEDTGLEPEEVLTDDEGGSK